MLCLLCVQPAWRNGWYSWYGMMLERTIYFKGRSMHQCLRYVRNTPRASQAGVRPVPASRGET